MKRVLLFLFAYITILVLSALWWFPQSRFGWLIFLIAAPPLYLFGEWLGERWRGDWWERSRSGKVAKAALIIVVALMALIVQVLVQS